MTQANGSCMPLSGERCSKRNIEETWYERWEGKPVWPEDRIAAVTERLVQENNHDDMPASVPEAKSVNAI